MPARHPRRIRHLRDLEPHVEAIERLVRRSEDLQRPDPGARGDRLASRRVVCHADLHTNNVLVLADGGLAIIDWDEVMLRRPSAT